MRAALLRRYVLAALVGLLSILTVAILEAAPLVSLDRVASHETRPAARAHLDRLRNDPALRRLGNVTQVDDRFGLPTFVWANRDEAKSRFTGSTDRGSIERAARAHLGGIAPLWRLESAEAEQLGVERTHDTGQGGIVVSFAQSIGGVEVFRDRLHVLMDRELRLIAVSGHLPSRAIADAGAARFDLDAPDAIAAALADFGAGGVTPAAIRRRGAARGGYESFEPPVADLRPVRAKRVLFHEPGNLEPAWYLELAGPGVGWSYVVSATDGAVLFRHNQVAEAAYTYRVWAEAVSPQLPFDGPQGIAPTPHPTGTPNFFAPPFVAPGLVTLESGPIATNDPWLPPGATETVGNNVDAFVDLSAPDGLSDGDFRASVTSPGTFDRVYDVDQPPGASSDQRMAAITQLFFASNHFHDWFYDAGFDESSGNAQASNYGRGGVEGDPLLAQAQDYLLTNSASMYTPADGASPIMQMHPYLYANGAKLIVAAPASIAGDHVAGTANFTPATFTISGELVLVSDGVGTSSDACEPIVNSVAGKIAVIDIGNCSAAAKAATAQAAGAIGVIIVNTAPNLPPPTLQDSPSVAIGVISATQETGNLLKAETAQGPVSVTIAMQPQVARDAALDNQIAAHEYGHLVSGRLIGNGNGLTTSQSGGMGEGWSDFHAIMMSVRAEDVLAPGNADFGGVYAIAGYAFGSSYALHNSYYFGTRRYPYSTDLTRNPLTFRLIQAGVALPVGPPLNGSRNPALNAAVHRTGEVWCTMLWECYAALLRDSGRLTFDQARDRMRRYLIASYKMTTAAPTFTEARDALLAVAYANDVADHALFCQAFARRGLGSGAVAPDRYSTTHAGVVESFACGGALSFVSASLSEDAAVCDLDGYLDNGERGWLRLTLRNYGAIALTGTSITVTSSHPGISFPGGNSVSSISSSPYSDLTDSIAVALAGATSLGAATFQIQYGDPALLVPGPRNTTYSTYVNVDEVASTVESVEPLSSTWTASAAADGVQETWRRIEIGPSDHRFFAQEPSGKGDLYLISPPIDVAPSGDLSFTFRHAYAFEYQFGVAYDGGVLELSEDGGVTWTDIGSFASPGYNGTLRADTDNPLRGRLAYVDRNAGYPALQTVTVNLGTAWAGETVRVRFRLGSNVYNAVTGWFVDDVSFTNVLNSPFTALVADPETCITTPTLLSRFEVRPRAGAIEIAWWFAEVTGPVGLERSTSPEGPWSVVEAERRRDGESFVALDERVEPGIAYFYRLVVLGEEGGVFGPVSAIVPFADPELSLERITPNPSSGDRVVRFTLPRDGEARLRVLDAAGREVERLFEGRLPAGSHEARWRSRVSPRVAPGVYFVTLEARGETRLRKAVVLE